MKTKFILLMVGILSFSINSFSQEQGFSCTYKEHVLDSKKIAKPTKPASTNPCSSDDISYLRVNVHFIQKFHQSTLDAGNFTETDDGLGNTNWTGYKHATKLVKRMNDYWKRSVQVALWPGSDQNPQSLPPVIVPNQILMRYTGTYFHQVPDAVYHTLGNGGSFIDIINNYGINLGEDINIFMMEDSSTCSTGGAAYKISSKYSSHLYNGWKIYANDPTDECADCTDCSAQGCGTCGDGTTAMSKVAVHEVGHLLNLQHSFCGFNNCSDIDQPQETEGPFVSTYPGCAAGGCDPCWVSGSNNVMAYVNTNVAFSPCQVGIMHNALDDLGDYIDHCCNDWTFLPTNPVEGKPAKKIHIACEEPVACDNDFEINVAKCFEFKANSNNAPAICFELDNFQTFSNCNNWTISFYNNLTGLLINRYYHSDENFVNQIFVGNSNSIYIEICVELCDENCQTTRCETFYAPYDFFREDDSENRSSQSHSGITNFEMRFENPNTGNFPIIFNQEVNQGELSIFDITGKKVNSQSLKSVDKTTINGLTAGAYLIQLNADGKQVTKKLIVQ